MRFLCDLQRSEGNDLSGEVKSDLVDRNILFSEFGGLLVFITLELEQVLEESEAIEIVNKGLKILIHGDVLDHHRQMILISCQRKGKPKISHNKFSQLFVFYNEAVYD